MRIVLELARTECLLCRGSHEVYFFACCVSFLCILLVVLHVRTVLQEQFDKSLARFETKEADLSKSYTDDNSGGDDSDVGAANGALCDLASELARAEEEMLGRSPTRAVSKDIDTSAVAQAAAAKALAKRKQVSTSGDPRSAMLAAIASRKKVDAEVTEASSDAAKVETAPAIDQRSAMLAAISSRKKPEEEDGETTDASPADEKKEVSPTLAPDSLDQRSAMLAAIASRKRPEESDTCPPCVDNDTQPAAEGDPMMANPVDPRSSMLSAIRARKVDKKSNDEAEEKNEPANQGGRAALMASIQAQRSPVVDEVNDAQAQAQDPRSTT